MMKMLKQPEVTKKEKFHVAQTMHDLKDLLEPKMLMQMLNSFPDLTPDPVERMSEGRRFRWYDYVSFSLSSPQTLKMATFFPKTLT
jgi:hypothetical protein